MKKIIILMILLIFNMVILSNIVNAFEFDNRDNYNETTKEYTVRNLLGFGRVLATIKLNTPQVYNVIDRGEGIKQMVGEFTINSTGSYTNALKNMQFYNVKVNHREFNRDFEYRKKFYFDVNVTDYIQECDVRNVFNGTENYNCKLVENGYHIEIKHRWEVFNSRDLGNEVVTLGIFLDVQRGETGDWIPTFYGRRLNKWAVWTDSFNDGLFAYYNFTGLTESVFGGDRNLINGGGSPVFVSNDTTLPLNNGFSGYSSVGNAWNVTVQDSFNFNETDQINMTIAGWIRRTGNSSGVFLASSKPTGGINWDLISGSGLTIRGNEGGVSHAGTGFLTTNTPIWFALTRNDTDICFVINGTLDTCSTSFLFGNVTGILVIGGNIALSDEVDIYIDELGFWNRTLTLSEISDLYNDGNGISFLPDSAVLIKLISPLSQNFTVSPQSLEFSANASDDVEIINISLYLDNILNQTLNGTGDNNLSFNQTLSLGEGSHEYNFSAEDGVNPRSYSITQTIIIDSTAPEVNVTTPHGVFDFHKIGNNLTINFTVTDLRLDTCWFEYNKTNTTVTCGDNNYSFITIIDQTNLTFFANDTLGKIGSNLTTWNYHVLEINQSFINNTIEGSLETFNISIRTNGSTLTVANLSYNSSTSTSGTITDQGENNFFVTGQINIPNVESDINQSFYWDMELADSFRVNSTTNNQTVRAITIDTCSTNSVLILNYTLRDEGTKDFLTASVSNTSIDINVNIFPIGSSIALLNFSQNYSEINPAQVCLNINLTTSFTMDVITKYNSDPRVLEYHHIQNFTLSNSTIPQVIELYDLKSDDSQEFKITFKDNQFSLVEDALIDITRLYVADGIFRSVEIPKTGSGGQTIGHFVLSDEVYTIIISKQGLVLATFENVITTCEDPTIQQCKLNLNAFSTGTKPTDFSTVDGLSFIVSLNSSSKILSLVFVNSPSGSVSTISLNATKFDSLGNASICSSQLTSSAGTITCTVPDSFGNVTIQTEIFKDGKLINYQFFTIEETANDIFGLDGIIFLLILVITLPLMAMSSKIVMLITGFLAFIIAALLNLYQGGSFIGVGSTIIWGIIAISIIIWKMGVEGE